MLLRRPPIQPRSQRFAPAQIENIIDDVVLVVVENKAKDKAAAAPAKRRGKAAAAPAAAPVAAPAVPAAGAKRKPAGKGRAAAAAAAAAEEEDEEDEVDVPSPEMEAELSKADVRFFAELDKRKKLDRAQLATIIKKCYCTPKLGDLTEDEVRGRGDLCGVGGRGAVVRRVSPARLREGRRDPDRRPWGASTGVDRAALVRQQFVPRYVVTARAVCGCCMLPRACDTRTHDWRLDVPRTSPQSRCDATPTFPSRRRRPAQIEELINAALQHVAESLGADAEDAEDDDEDGEGLTEDQAAELEAFVAQQDAERAAAKAGKGAKAKAGKGAAKKAPKAKRAAPKAKAPAKPRAPKAAAKAGVARAAKVAAKRK